MGESRLKRLASSLSLRLRLILGKTYWLARIRILSQSLGGECLVRAKKKFCNVFFQLAPCVRIALPTCHVRSERGPHHFPFCIQKGGKGVTTRGQGINEKWFESCDLCRMAQTMPGSASPHALFHGCRRFSQPGYVYQA